MGIVQDGNGHAGPETDRKEQLCIHGDKTMTWRELEKELLFWLNAHKQECRNGEWWVNGINITKLSKDLEPIK